jgi:cobalamin biosynthesis protein CobD/CbiB
VRLGGTNYYDGMAVTKPLIGAGNPVPAIGAARAACRIVTAASLVSFIVALLGALAWHA